MAGGASWRNFQVKYREINDLHQQCSDLGQVEAMGAGAARDRARITLPRQSNDCYGTACSAGLHHPHARGTHAHLIAAEDLADRAIDATGAGGSGGALRGKRAGGPDLDARRGPARHRGPGRLVIDPDEGAGMGLDLRAARMPSLRAPPAA